MSYTEIKAIDKIELVGAHQILQVREATTVIRDSAEIAKTYHRWSFVPGDDLSAMPANVQAIAAAAWTPEIIAAYKEHMAAQSTGAQA